jgi:hypothetical protein
MARGAADDSQNDRGRKRAGVDDCQKRRFTRSSHFRSSHFYNVAMNAAEIQQACQLGNDQLIRMQYLAAERTLAAAEEAAWEARDFDSLARLYMPLQEARRQRRQRCGEGVVRLDLARTGPDDPLNAAEIIGKFPQGQLLLAGWGSIQPAIEARRLAADRGLYVEIFLAAVYPAGAERVIAIVPTEEFALPAAGEINIDALLRRLPAHCIVLAQSELGQGTHAQVMSLWERLHAPFLALADSATDLRRKIDGYRRTIRVDYACELAHQKLSDAARELARSVPIKHADS